MLRILLPRNAKTREKFYFLHQNLSMLRVLITAQGKLVLKQEGT